MNFISIETTSDICSVSVFVDNQLKDSINYSQEFSHSKNLTLFVNKIINKNKINKKKLDFICVSIGPGSYTGIKVGTSFAKGMAYVLDIPLVPINTIDALNYSLQEMNKYYIALYSHREYVYYQKFNAGKAISKQLCDKASKLNDYKIFGYQLNKIKNFDYFKLSPSSVNIGLLALEKFNKLAIKDYDSISPVYLSVINQ